jgi:glycosyltransferase involved in cell wall biosynthesis
MHFFIHALGASAGGGITYIRNVIPQLLRSGATVTVLASRQAIPEIAAHEGLTILSGQEETGSLSRFLWEQRHIPVLIRKQSAEILLSAGNFAVWNSPVPQILLSRNSLYTSPEFARDLRQRREFVLLADHVVKAYVAKKSIRRATIVVAPSEQFARDLTRWSGTQVVGLHHGFDADRFFCDQTGLPHHIEEKIEKTKATVRLLFVSHYNYYRNFETLFRALALVKKQQPQKAVRLLLTCELAPGKNPGRYKTGQAAALVRELGLEEEVIQLGAIPYPSLHHVYRACDMYVSAAYAETFAHPLVEAMASGLPIIASDLPVHREIADGAALFFSTFSAEDLAERILQVAQRDDLRDRLRCAGHERAKAFSWSAHVDQLMAIANSLLERGTGAVRSAAAK